MSFCSSLWVGWVFLLESARLRNTFVLSCGLGNIQLIMAGLGWLHLGQPSSVPCGPLSSSRFTEECELDGLDRVPREGEYVCEASWDLDLELGQTSKQARSKWWENILYLLMAGAAKSCRYGETWRIVDIFAKKIILLQMGKNSNRNTLSFFQNMVFYYKIKKTFYTIPASSLYFNSPPSTILPPFTRQALYISVEKHCFKGALRTWKEFREEGFSTGQKKKHRGWIYCVFEEDY